MKVTTQKLSLVAAFICSFTVAGCAAQDTPKPARQNASLATNINHLLTEEQLPGLVLTVRKNNRVVHHKAYGYADIEKKIPMTEDQLFRLFSMTKPITALTTLQVLEEKGIELDTPLQKIFPQFEQHSDIPLSTVMTHTSGFSYGFKINRWAGWLYLFANIGSSKSLPEFIDRLAELPLLSEPGVRWRYSFSSDVQGAMVEKLTGQKLSQNMQQRLFDHLAMNDTGFYVEPKDTGRLAPMYSSSWFGSAPNKHEAEEVTQSDGPESGGGGLVSTAMDYSKFVQMLMTPEDYPDIVSKEHVRQLTTTQLPEHMATIPSRYYTNSGYSYGMGVKLKDETYLSKGSFYWAGKGGTIFWADPKRDLSVVVMMQYEGGNKILEKSLIPIIYKWLDSNENTTG